MCGAVVQLVRTSACHAEGREFESRQLRQLFVKRILGFMVILNDYFGSKIEFNPFNGITMLKSNLFYILLMCSIQVSANDYKAIGFSPLFIAIARGVPEESIERLITPENCSHRSTCGSSALHVALYHGCSDNLLMRLTCDETLSDSQDSDGDSPLHVAVKMANVNAVRFLRARCDLDLRNAHGMTPQQLADYVLRHPQEFFCGYYSSRLDSLREIAALLS